MDKKLIVVLIFICAVFASVAIAASYTAEATFEYIPAVEPVEPIIEPVDPVVPVDPEECAIKEDEEGEMVVTGECAITEPVVESNAKKSVVYWMKMINSKIGSNKLNGGGVLVYLTGSSKSSVEKTKVKLSTTSTSADQKTIENISVGNLSEVEVDGKKLFVVDLKNVELGQKFSIDLSDVEIDYSSVYNGLSDGQGAEHGEYVFELVGASKNLSSAGVYRFVHFKATNEGKDVDCNPFWSVKNFNNELDSIKKTYQINGASGILKDTAIAFVGSTLARFTTKVPAWLAGKAAAKVGLLRILGLGVAGKVVHSASVLTGPAVVLSKAAYGDWTDTDKSVWDPRKYLPAVFSKNFTVDLASSETTYPCMENTYIKGEGKSPELRINVKDVEIYDSGKSLKLFFTVDAMQKYSRSDPIYYASFPS